MTQEPARLKDLVKDKILDLEFSRIHFRKRRSLSGNPKTCAGCRTCEVICSLRHEGSVDLEKSRIIIQDNSLQGSFIPRVCHQCSDAPCFYACPESAIEIDKSYGTVRINKEKCTGCHACEAACPFKMIRFDPQENQALKCDFCHGDPECVKWCPMNALGVTEFGGDSR